ncbi:MAG: hypothetical protein PHW04_15385 [Candidatus Wallbacteria bacterium]|nr:hypothetical protein [Candidatus Wallbacteria bacterium]
MSEKKWQKFIEVMEKEKLCGFVPEMILELSRRILHLGSGEAEYFSRFTDQEKKIFKSFWEMDFQISKNSGYFFSVLPLFADAFKEFSQRSLGAVTDLVLCFSNDRFNLRSFLTLAIIDTYIGRGDFQTGTLLLDNIREQNQKKWQVLMGTLRLKIVAESQDYERVTRILTEMLSIYDAREEEFRAVGLPREEIYLQLSKNYSRQGFLKKAVSLMKKIVADPATSPEKTAEALKSLREQAEESEKNGDFELALELLEWLCTLEMPPVESAQAFYKAGIVFINRAKAEAIPEKAEGYLKRAHFYFSRLEEKHPEAPELKKIGYRFIKRQKLDELKQKGQLKKHIWIFFCSFWIFLLFSFFLQIPLPLLPIVFALIYAALYLAFTFFVSKWLFGDLEM